MERTFVIGDIHGALKAIKQVISSIKPRETDTLIFLGDYVDGWPESAQVIEFLTELEGRHNCIFLKGNHDFDCESWLGGNPDSTDWSERRGLTTIKSYEQLEDRHKPKHLHFLSRLPLYHIDKQNRLFLHAGFRNNEGPQFETPSINLLTDRSLWELALMMAKRIKTNPSLLPGS
ncbi:MAG: metallophosphoesterase [Pseudobacter sp.]|uniref:metallophosphoesterase n=1 Tax=Pseudobacter sp. TaxID=2045420 RepID=UPI003F7F4DDF